MSTAFFDLDRTLIDCNSGRLWVAHEWRSGRIGLRDVAWATWWLGRYSLGLGDGLDRAFEAAVATYAGEAEHDVIRRTDAWFDDEVARRIRPGAQTALQTHRARGDRLVLATSSTLYVARAAAARWDLDDVICTRMEVDDGHFTGRIAELAYGDAKQVATRAWAEREGVSLSECSFYTDSVTDVALLDEVGDPQVVNPDRALRRQALARGWPISDWGRSAG